MKKGKERVFLLDQHYHHERINCLFCSAGHPASCIVTIGGRGSRTILPSCEQCLPPGNWPKYLSASGIEIVKGDVALTQQIIALAAALEATEH